VEDISIRYRLIAIGNGVVIGNLGMPNNFSRLALMNGIVRFWFCLSIAVIWLPLGRIGCMARVKVPLPGPMSAQFCGWSACWDWDVGEEGKRFVKLWVGCQNGCHVTFSFEIWEGG